MLAAKLERKCDGCPSLESGECLDSNVIRLSNYSPGDKGKILQICGEPDFRLRMMEMGFVRGAEIEVVKYAPLMDPVEFIVKGYHVTLRKEQAEDILMDMPEKVA